MHCARGAQGPRGCMVGLGKAVSAHPHVCFTPLQAAVSQGLSSETHLLDFPSPTPEVGSEGKGHGVSLLLLGYLQFSERGCRAQSP